MSARAGTAPAPAADGLDVAALLDGPWVLVPAKQAMHDGSRLATYGVQADGLWIGRAHPLGPEPAEQALARRHAALFTASKAMATVLQEAVEAFAGAFEGGPLPEAEFAAWFARWRERARAALAPLDGA